MLEPRYSPAERWPLCFVLRSLRHMADVPLQAPSILRLHCPQDYHLDDSEGHTSWVLTVFGIWEQGPTEGYVSIWRPAIPRMSSFTTTLADSWASNYQRNHFQGGNVRAGSHFSKAQRYSTTAYRDDEEYGGAEGSTWLRWVMRAIWVWGFFSLCRSRVSKGTARNGAGSLRELVSSSDFDASALLIAAIAWNQ